jgi:hypothetical protein
MKIKIFSFLLITTTLMFSGCGEDEADESNTTVSTQGWHFQGRDCLACHNVDLNPDKHLLFGGTLYVDQSVQNQDDLNNVCGGEFVINFIDDTTGVTIYSSKDYIDANSNGYDAKGNLFILQRKLRLISAGNYTVQITDTNGTVMAAAGGHSFSSADYDINTPKDSNNRLACNACHSNSGPQLPIYVQINKNLCQ